MVKEGNEVWHRSGRKDRLISIRFSYQSSFITPGTG